MNVMNLLKPTLHGAWIIHLPELYLEDVFVGVESTLQSWQFWQKGDSRKIIANTSTAARLYITSTFHATVVLVFQNLLDEVYWSILREIKLNQPELTGQVPRDADFYGLRMFITVGGRVEQVFRRHEEGWLVEEVDLRELELGNLILRGNYSEEAFDYKNQRPVPYTVVRLPKPEQDTLRVVPKRSVSVASSKMVASEDCVSTKLDEEYDGLLPQLILEKYVASEDEPIDEVSYQTTGRLPYQDFSHTSLSSSSSIYPHTGGSIILRVNPHANVVEADVASGISPWHSLRFVQESEADTKVRTKDWVQRLALFQPDTAIEPSEISTTSTSGPLKTSSTGEPEDSKEGSRNQMAELGGGIIEKMRKRLGFKHGRARKRRKTLHEGKGTAASPNQETSL